MTAKHIACGNITHRLPCVSKTDVRLSLSRHSSACFSLLTRNTGLRSWIPLSSRAATMLFSYTLSSAHHITILDQSLPTIFGALFSSLSPWPVGSRLPPSPLVSEGLRSSIISKGQALYQASSTYTSLQILDHRLSKNPSLLNYILLLCNLLFQSLV